MFLADLEPRNLTDSAPAGLTPTELFLGLGDAPLQVAVFTATRPPTRPELRTLHDARKKGQIAPVMIVVLHGTTGAALATHTGLELELVEEMERSLVERLARRALSAADRHAAYRLISTTLRQLGSKVPGLRNAGLFSMQELEHGVPARGEWAGACAKARPWLTLTGRSLIEALGYTIQPMPGPASVLLANDQRRAVAVFVERVEQIEASGPLWDDSSPVTYALSKADKENLDYVVVSAGSTVRVYPVKLGVGTGRRGRTETYVELDAALLPEAKAGYLALLASAAALADGGTFESVLETSREYAVALGERLRDRVYEEVVPGFADAIVKARRLRNPSAEKLAESYQMALLVLFRLLFVSYAEDKELLPLHSSKSYRDHSLKRIAQRLAEEQEAQAEYGSGDQYWTEVRQLWKAIDKGNKPWNVPAYNGGLFSSESTGAAQALEALTLSDAVFAPPLRALLLDEAEEGRQMPIDFRSLGVREFGTIYEGLLEQELAVAGQDLGVDRKTGAYVPAKRGIAVVVPEGKVYLHNASGARKASGAYYTKEFAVEHLLEHALDPALDDHLARVKARYDAREQAARFFDFHVADIAMGSGHFLVAAIDRIERKLSGYLAENPLVGVRAELDRLRQAAREALGDDYGGDQLEDTQLLRRQIARRCVFGVDMNPLAVELARLSIWIHTFVPGLPLSFLDQNLVVGNSLVGIATFEEAKELLGAGEDLFAVTAEELLSGAREPLEKLARLADATVAEVKEAKKLYAQARAAIKPTEDLFTILAASRLDRPAPGEAAKANASRRSFADKSKKEQRLSEVVEGRQLSVRTMQNADVFADRLVRRAEKVLAGLRPMHFPIAFPQVFLGERPGFDVILGNPPWEKVKLEEHEFWARHFPGFRGLSQKEREIRWPAMRRARPDLVAEYWSEAEKTDALRTLLTSGGFPGMGSGDPDLYKAFCWRFWSLIQPSGGQIGVVLPRAVFAAKGSEQFRHTVFDNDGWLDLTTLVNSRGWVFENVDPRYSIALSVFRRGRGPREKHVFLRGPYSDRHSFHTRSVREPATFSYEAVREWTAGASLPLFPREDSGPVFLKLHASPRFGDQSARDWLARPVLGDIHTTADKDWLDFDNAPSRARWPVYAGESFDIWNPDSGRYYAVAEAKPLTSELEQRRAASATRAKGAFASLAPETLRDPKTLPCRNARIAFRDVTRATDVRTSRSTLVPPNVFMVHTAAHLLFARGGPSAAAFVLGVMSSIPFDWMARRVVETHMTFEVLDGLPVPDSPLSAKMAKRAIGVSARLATPDDRFEEWASHFGLKPKSLDVDEKDDLICELDAAVSLLYGLDEKDVRHIFETFHVGWDFEERLRNVLRHFKRLSTQR